MWREVPDTVGAGGDTAREGPSSGARSGRRGGRHTSEVADAGDRGAPRPVRDRAARRRGLRRLAHGHRSWLAARRRDRPPAALPRDLRRWRLGRAPASPRSASRVDRHRACHLLPLGDFRWDQIERVLARSTARQGRLRRVNFILLKLTPQGETVLQRRLRPGPVNSWIDRVTDHTIRLLEAGQLDVDPWKTVQGLRALHADPSLRARLGGPGGPEVFDNQPGRPP